MPKKIRLVVAGLLMFVATAVPYGTTVSAAPRQQQEREPSLAFLECTENTYRNRRDMMNDWCIWRIQTFLTQMKWMRTARNLNVRDWPTLELDALYGPETEKAVKAYQKSTQTDGVPGNAGPVDGIVGHRTWASIQRDCVDRWGHDKDFFSEACF